MKKILLFTLMTILSISALSGTGRDKFNNLYNQLRPFARDYLAKGRSSDKKINISFEKVFSDIYQMTASDFKKECKKAKMNPAEMLAKMTALDWLTTEETKAKLGIHLTEEEDEEIIEISLEMQELIAIY
jgi:hypothetical protein